MRPRDDKKRKLILAAAARLFSQRPFHKVLLDDVAAQAGIGKGTVYIYFRSKEDLYFSLLFDGFSSLVDDLNEKLAVRTGTAISQLRTIVQALVDFGHQKPHLNEVMRSAMRSGSPPPKPSEHARWDKKHKALMALIEQTIQWGVRNGQLIDPHPEITALYIPGFIRSVMHHGKDVPPRRLVEHLMGVLEHGLARPPLQGAAS